MHVDRSWLTILVVVFGTRWLVASSTVQHAKRVADSLHFKGSLAIRILCGLGAPIAFYGAGVVASSSTVKSDWWVAVVLALVGFAALAMWPEELVTTATSISQSRFLGLGMWTKAWSDIDYATENSAKGSIEVSPRVGRKFIHTRLHVGHGDFLAVVRRHYRMF